MKMLMLKKFPQFSFPKPQKKFWWLKTNIDCKGIKWVVEEGKG
jgi:hypothetical protein